MLFSLQGFHTNKKKVREMLCGSSGFLFLPAGHSGCFWVWPPCATKVNATVVKRDTPRDVWNVFVLDFTHMYVQYSYASTKGFIFKGWKRHFGCTTERGGLVATALFVCCLVITERHGTNCESYC